MAENSLALPTSLESLEGLSTILFSFQPQKKYSLILYSSLSKFVSRGTKEETRMKSWICEENMTFKRSSESRGVIFIKL